MTHKGYEGIAKFDEEAGMFTGEVINTRDVITFQGKSVAELKRAFEESVEDYLEFCASRGEEPDKPFSGMFTVRMSPEMHRHVALEAQRKGKSLNAYVVGRLKPSMAMPA
jgi:predicted HicB family RNase H-like nuclease